MSSFLNKIMALFTIITSNNSFRPLLKKIQRDTSNVKNLRIISLVNLAVFVITRRT